MSRSSHGPAGGPEGRYEVRLRTWLYRHAAEQRTQPEPVPSAAAGNEAGPDTDPLYVAPGRPRVAPRPGLLVAVVVLLAIVLIGGLVIQRGDGSSDLADGREDLSEVVAHCPDEFRGLDGPGTHELFTLAQVWMRVLDAEFSHPDEMEGLTERDLDVAGTYQADPAYVIHSLQGALLRGDEVPERAFLGRQMAAGVLRSLEAGDQVLVGFGSWGVMAAISVGESEVRFLGLCAEENYGPRLAEVNDHLEATRGEEIGSRSDRVIEFATDPDGLLLKATEEIYQAFEAPAWTELDPDSRAVGPGDTPPEELARLQRYALMVNLTEPIDGGAAYSFCPKTAAGWSLCVNLGVHNERTPITAEIYGQPGERAEIWVFESPVRLDDPLHQIGSVTLPDAGYHVIMDFAPEVTFDALRDRPSDYVTIRDTAS